MNEERETFEAVKTLEKQDKQEVPQSVESPEELRQQIMAESQEQTNSFKNECATDLAQIETRASTEGLIIDVEDKEALVDLNIEADTAQAELIAEMPPSLPSMPPPLPEQAHITPPPIPEVYRTTPPPLPKTPPPIPQNISAMKERIVENPELLDKKEVSKKLLSEERTELAQKIRAERQLSREKILVLKEKSSALNSKLEKQSIDLENVQKEYEELNNERAEEANSFAGRVRSFITKTTGHEFVKDVELEKSLQEKQKESEKGESDTQTLQEEVGNLVLLIEGDTSRKEISEKIKEHYAKSDEIAQKRFDTQNRSLEHVMKRNNAFIVHVIAEKKGVRHNENSNVSSEITYSDDIDITLAFEPSISASSVTPGEKATLWPGQSGLLLSGGQIGEVGASDIGTTVSGIKHRGRKDSSIEEIDEVVGRQDKWSRQTYERFGKHGYNELVVNNPEVFGFFQHAEMDEKGRFWADSVENTRHLSEEMPDFYGSGPSDSNNRQNLKSTVESYREHFAVASERGIPLYVMTPDRNVYECFDVNDDGTVAIGKQLTPEEVAVGRAGLLAEKRKEIGEKLLEKQIFREEETMEEARGIISDL